ncbi:MAG: hypothetical protein V9H26_09965 [Verrucomicrobiota bacterium]
MSSSRLLIVDGHAYAYRAFYAIRNLRSPAGQPTNAIYGFIKMLAKMRVRVQPTHTIVVWDGGLSAVRQAALPEYKAQRPEMPADPGVAVGCDWTVSRRRESGLVLRGWDRSG